MRNKFLLYEYRILSSAELHISDFSMKKNISFMNILNSSRPNIDPSGILRKPQTIYCRRIPFYFFLFCSSGNQKKS